MKHSLILLLTLLCVACSGGSASRVDAGSFDNDAATFDAGPDADPGLVPRIEVVACRYTIAPDLNMTAGTDYQCQDLITYEDRDKAGRTIAVHSVRFFSAAESNNATIYFEGGPGANGSSMVRRLGVFGSSFLNALMVDGDFLVIAQRGTTLSVPSLDCQGAYDCQSLSDDLPAYNTAYNADDVDELRSLLGYEKLNIYGISYGSRLALEVLRRHGDNVRSAVVGGLVPSQIIWPAGIPASFYGALRALNSSCSSDGACGAAYGNLVGDFSSGVDALNVEPIALDNGSIFLDGYSYAALLFQLMYSNASYPFLPMIISDLAEGRTDRIDEFVSNAIYSLGSSSIARGMYSAVVCGEMFSPPNEAAFEAMNAEVPTNIKDTLSGGWYSSLDTCSSWPNGPLQAELSQPVTSAVPTFVASGTIDPITPPLYGAAAAEHLSNALVVTYANSGHGATVQTTCGRETFLSFLANPDISMDVSCADNITIDYVLPSVAPLPGLDTTLLQLDVEQSPIPPALREAVRSAIKK